MNNMIIRYKQAEIRLLHTLGSYAVLALISLIILPQTTPTYAQKATSNVCKTLVGSPTLEPGQTLEQLKSSLGCEAGNSGGGIPGNYQFPVSIGLVTAVATEMAAYPGGYDYGGHREHAGLDIGTPIAQRIPVFAVANGTVSNARSSCYIQSEGASCRLDISNDGDNFISSYSHIDVNQSVRVGTKVQKGQQIAVIHYWIEYSSMDHLHFELLDKTRLDAFGTPININPRNYLPELQQFKPYGYGNSGQDVRNYTDSTGYFWATDGKEYAETYRNHPPCQGGTGCWAQ